MQTCDPLSLLESRVFQTQILQILILNQIPSLSTQSSERGQTLGTDVGVASHGTHYLCSGKFLKILDFFTFFFLVHSSCKFRDGSLEEPRK